MTDAHVQSLEEIEDLNSNYDMVQQAISSDNLDQALRLAFRGLEQAKEISHEEWIHSFQVIKSEIETAIEIQKEDDAETQAEIKQTELQKEITDDFTVLRGIGPSAAERLIKGGISTIVQLSKKRPEQIAHIKGFGITTAMKLIEEANTFLLESESDDSNDIKIEESNAPSKETTKKPLTPLQIISKKRESQMSLEQFTPEPQEKEIVVDKEKEVDFVEEEKSFSENLKHSRVSQLITPPKEANEPSENSTSEDPVEERKKQEEFLLPPSNLNPEIKSNIPSPLEQVKTIFEQNEYQCIPNHLKVMQPFFFLIDVLAYKITHLKENQFQLLVIPVKIFNSKETIVVSEQTVKLQSQIAPNPAEESLFELMKCVSKINDALSQDNDFFHFFQKYSRIPFIIEDDKNLVYISGQNTYHILISPILITTQEPAFIEKSIPFAYQRYSEMHIVNTESMEDLLDFLEIKQIVIERYSKNKSNTKPMRQKAKDILLQRIRITSIASIIYGVLFAVILMSEFYTLVPTFLNTGYAFIGLYTLGFAYYSYDYIKKVRKGELNLTSDNHSDMLELDDTDILLIKEEFSDDFFLQFDYECFGKDSQFDCLNPVKPKAIKKPNSVKTPTIKEFKKETHMKPEEIPKTDILNKYSSFLED